MVEATSTSRGRCSVRRSPGTAMGRRGRRCAATSSRPSSGSRPAPRWARLLEELARRGVRRRDQQSARRRSSGPGSSVESVTPRPSPSLYGQASGPAATGPLVFDRVAIAWPIPTASSAGSSPVDRRPDRSTPTTTRSRSWTSTRRRAGTRWWSRASTRADLLEISDEDLTATRARRAAGGQAHGGDPRAGRLQPDQRLRAGRLADRLPLPHPRHAPLRGRSAEAARGSPRRRPDQTQIAAIARRRSARVRRRSQRNPFDGETRTDHGSSATATSP